MATKTRFRWKKGLIFYHSKNLLEIWLKYKKFIRLRLYFAMFVPSALNIVCRVHISKIAMNPNIICQDPEDYILRRRYLNNPNLREVVKKNTDILRSGGAPGLTVAFVKILGLKAIEYGP